MDMRNWIPAQGGDDGPCWEWRIHMTEANIRGRLRFRSWHRGTREMDLLMGSFADAQLPTFTDEQLTRYEAVLELSDPDLYNWITGAVPLPVEHDNDVVRLLCAHTFAKASG